LRFASPPPDVTGWTIFKARQFTAAEKDVLTSLPFDAANVDAGAYRHTVWAAEAAAYGQNRCNYLGAPPIMNFGFSIELYIKLLRNLADGNLMHGHNLHDLFLKLDEAAPQVGSAAIRNHYSSRGCREEFLKFIRNEASLFEEWRYAYEKEFLCSSPDTLFLLANAFRKTVWELHPVLRSAFHPTQQ
jgi:hypothetical protein